jgi:hypothetical protein
MTWEPVTLEKLYDKILGAEEEMHGELLRFWELIQIFPEKWAQESYGKEGGGFWVVAVCGKHIIWYNDIEEGFNTSPYKRYGEFEEYWCNQDDLQWPVKQMLSIVKFGGELGGGFGPPQPVDES